MRELEEVYGPVIYSYTREQAIEDGVLVDVSEWAREKGIPAPTAFSSHLWTDVDVDSKKGHKGYQSTRGRADDVLWMAFLRLAAANRAGKLDEGPHAFEVLLSVGRTRKQTLWVAMDGADVTIMYPEDN